MFLPKEATIRCIDHDFRNLGAHIDDRLRFRQFAKDIRDRCEKRVNFLRSTAGSYCGAHPECLLTLARTTIFSVIEYAGLILRAVPKSVLLPIERIRWKCLRTIGGFMRSPHTMSIEVILGIPPLSVRLDFLAEKFIMKSFSRRKSDLCESIVMIHEINPNNPLTRGISIDEYRNGAYVSRIHDFPLESFLFVPNISFKMKKSLLEVPRDLYSLVAGGMVRGLMSGRELNVFYTDGSKNSVGVGAGLYSEKGICRSERLSNECSVFVAEATALRMAFEEVAESPLGEYLVMSDSESVHRALESQAIYANVHSEIWRCKGILSGLNNRGYVTRLAWVPFTLWNFRE